MLGIFRRRSPIPRLSRPRLRADDVAVVYAIGDIHGCYDLLLELIERIRQDAKHITGRRILVTLGDYVDRGPRSAEVLNWLCGPAPEGFDRISLAGNHEAMMLEFLASPSPSSPWLDFGGMDTLDSYGVDVPRFVRARRQERLAILKASIPVAHVNLLTNLPSLLELAEVVFVHAGLRPGFELSEQVDVDLLWIREPFLSGPADRGPLVVHGHTPAAAPVVTGRRICVDTGAFATGVLTAVRLTAQEGPCFIDTAGRLAP